MSLERGNRVRELEVSLILSPLRLGLLTSLEGPLPTLVLNAVFGCIGPRHPFARVLKAWWLEPCEKYLWNCTLAGRARAPVH